MKSFIRKWPSLALLGFALAFFFSSQVAPVSGEVDNVITQWHFVAQKVRNFTWFSFGTSIGIWELWLARLSFEFSSQGGQMWVTGISHIKMVWGSLRCCWWPVGFVFMFSGGIKIWSSGFSTFTCGYEAGWAYPIFQFSQEFDLRPMNPVEIVQLAATAIRYVREWVMPLTDP